MEQAREESRLLQEARSRCDALEARVAQQERSLEEKQRLEEEAEQMRCVAPVGAASALVSSPLCVLCR